MVLLNKKSIPTVCVLLYSLVVNIAICKEPNKDIETIGAIETDATHVLAEQVVTTLDPTTQKNIEIMRSALYEQIGTVRHKTQEVIQSLTFGGRRLGTYKENKLLASALSDYLSLLSYVHTTLTPEEFSSPSHAQTAMLIGAFALEQMQLLVNAKGAQILALQIEQSERELMEFLALLGNSDLQGENLDIATLQSRVEQLCDQSDALLNTYTRLGKSVFRDGFDSFIKTLEKLKVRETFGVTAGGIAALMLVKSIMTYEEKQNKSLIILSNNNNNNVQNNTPSLDLFSEGTVGALLKYSGLLFAGNWIWEKVDKETGFTDSVDRAYKFTSNGLRTVIGKTIDRLRGKEDPNKQYGLYPDIMESWRIRTSKTFEDAVGLDHVKERLERVISFIQNPDEFAGRGLSPGNLLFTGPSRTGKSYIAECLAGEANLRSEDGIEFNFYSIPASDVLVVGIKEFMMAAAEKAPCVVIIDEFHLLGLQSTGTNPSLLADFLCGMSGCDAVKSDKPMILIGITTDPENIDKALRQKGRFDQEIRFLKPALDERYEYIARKTAVLGISLNPDELNQLALETDGCVYEELSAMISSACVKSLLKGTFVDYSTLLDAFDYEVRQIVPSMPINLTPAEQKIVATNQVGQAMALALISEDTQYVSKLTLLPVVTKIVEEFVGSNMGYPDEYKQSGVTQGSVFTYRTTTGSDIMTLDQKITLCKKYVAGFAAEQVLLGQCGYSYNVASKNSAVYVARDILAKGVADDLFSKTEKNNLYNNAVGLVDQYETEMRELLSEHQNRLDFLVKLLIAAKDINGAFIYFALEKSDDEIAELSKRLDFVEEIQHEVGPMHRSWIFDILLATPAEYQSQQKEFEAVLSQQKGSLEGLVGSQAVN